MSSNTDFHLEDKVFPQDASSNHVFPILLFKSLTLNREQRWAVGN